MDLQNILTIVFICVAIFLVYQSGNRSGKIAKGTHYESYILKVIFYSKNFKWILLAFILVVMAILFLLPEQPECPQGQLNGSKDYSWFHPLPSVSVMVVMMHKK